MINSRFGKLFCLLCILFLLQPYAWAQAAPEKEEVTYEITQRGLSASARMTILSMDGIQSDTNVQYIDLNHAISFSNVLNSDGTIYTALNYLSTSGANVTRYIQEGADIYINCQSIASLKTEGTFTGSISMTGGTVGDLILDSGTFHFTNVTLTGTVEIRGDVSIWFEDCSLQTGATLARSSTPAIYVDGDPV